jgi:hypothetical protein
VKSYELTGEDLKEIGIELVETNEGGPNAEFFAEGLAVYEQFCETYPDTYTAEDIRDCMISRPHHPNAWGALARKARAAGLVTVVGYVKARCSPRHASMIPAYVGRLHPQWQEKSTLELDD